MSLFGDCSSGERPTPVFDDARVQIPEHRVRQDRAPGLREGDARPLRQRPPARSAPRRPCAGHADATVAGRSAEQREGELRLGRRGGHQPGPQVHQEGRADGDLHPRGPRGLDRGLGASPARCRTWATCSPTTPSSASGPPRPARRRAQAHLHGARRPELILDGTEPPLHLELPLDALTDERLDRLRELLNDHPGALPVLLRVGAKVIRAGRGLFTVDARSGLARRAPRAVSAAGLSFEHFPRNRVTLQTARLHL